MKIILEKERPISLNQYYAGMHWSKRSEEAKRVHYLMMSKIQRGVTFFKNPVEIEVTCYFKSNPMDADNIVAKLYIDGLKGKVLVDDTPKYVKGVKLVSLVDVNNPRVEIEITEV